MAQEEQANKDPPKGAGPEHDTHPEETKQLKPADATGIPDKPKESTASITTVSKTKSILKTNTRKKESEKEGNADSNGVEKKTKSAKFVEEVIEDTKHIDLGERYVFKCHCDVQIYLGTSGSPATPEQSKAPSQGKQKSTGPMSEKEARSNFWECRLISYNMPTITHC